MNMVLKIGDLPVAKPVVITSAAPGSGATVESLVVSLDAGGLGALNALMATGYGKTQEEVVHRALLDATRAIYKSAGQNAT